MFFGQNLPANPSWCWKDSRNPTQVSSLHVLYADVTATAAGFFFIAVTLGWWFSRKTAKTGVFLALRIVIAVLTAMSLVTVVLTCHEGAKQV